MIENQLDETCVLDMNETAFQTNTVSKRAVAVRGSNDDWNENVAFSSRLGGMCERRLIIVSPLVLLSGQRPSIELLSTVKSLDHGNAASAHKPDYIIHKNRRILYTSRIKTYHVLTEFEKRYRFVQQRSESNYIYMRFGLR